MCSEFPAAAVADNCLPVDALEVRGLRFISIFFCLVEVAAPFSGWSFPSGFPVCSWVMRGRILLRGGFVGGSGAPAAAAAAASACGLP